MRAFVIGNGPSLNKTPLDRLVDEATFAVNRIHLIYPRTPWRPSHWVLADRSKSLEHVHDMIVHLELGEDCYVREDFVSDLLSVRNHTWPNLTLLSDCEHVDANTNPAWSWHLPGLCRFGGSVLVAIQLAVVWGFNPIYVVGCDLGYKGNDINHFDPKYIDVDSRKVSAAMLANETLRLAHDLAYRECRERGVEVYNAGVGGMLTTYPRVRLEEIL